MITKSNFPGNYPPMPGDKVDSEGFGHSPSKKKVIDVLKALEGIKRILQEVVKEE